MKGIHILCASQSSTSTLGKEEEGGVAAAPGPGGRGPAIDRYNPIIHEQSRLLLLNPNIENAKDDYTISFKEEKEDDCYAKKETRRRRRRGSGDSSSSSIIKNWSINSIRGRGRRSWSCININPGGFITPPATATAASSSSRFLLTQDTPLNSLQPMPEQSSSQVLVPPFQVVVLRVSLHCRGCEKKLRKHISTMQGVSSYNIEFATKKVTVEGNVTPSAVLASISKVKNAQLWFPAPAPAPPPPPPQTISEINNTPTTIIQPSSST